MDWQRVQYIQNLPRVKIIRKFEDIPAVLVKVDNGRGMLSDKLIRANFDEMTYDYNMYSRLTFNDTALVHIYSNGCPTCARMLAAGYGLNNVFSPELVEVGRRINSEFVSIEKSAGDMSPLLTLLESGVYLIADLPHIPTDGEGNFFWNISSEKHTFDADVSCYINLNAHFMEHYPKFLYPTQNTKLHNPERVNYYKRLMEFSKNPPRPLVYSLGTFMSAVLDGHHKTCAAALVGREINCLTIMKPSLASKDPVKSVSFYYGRGRKLEITLDECSDLKEVWEKMWDWRSHNKPDSACNDNDEISYHIFDKLKGFGYDEAALNYLTVDDLSYADLYNPDKLDENKIDEYFHQNDTLVLTSIMKLESFKRNSIARYTAIKVIENTIENINKDFILDWKFLCEAIKALDKFHDEQTEQLIIDLLVYDDRIPEPALGLAKNFLE